MPSGRHAGLGRTGQGRHPGATGHRAGPGPPRDRSPPIRRQLRRVHHHRPHHITTALRELGQEERIVFQRGTTRGGSTIQTIQPADQHRRTTPIAEASARKRLLLARYNSWAQGNKRYPEGPIGPAGEESVRKAILGSGTVIPAAPGAAAVSSILNIPVAGPLDSAGYVMSFDANGIPAQPVTTLFEVKNIRSWVYPGAGELFQLLSKAVVVQTAHPTVPILPIFICRRAHQTTFYMAKQLGFFVIEMRRQPIGPVETEPFLEVRNGLAFTDLITGSDANPQVQRRLATVLPKFSATMSAVWRETALDPRYVQAINRARVATQAAARARQLDELRRLSEHRGLAGGW